MQDLELKGIHRYEEAIKFKAHNRLDNIWLLIDLIINKN